MDQILPALRSLIIDYIAANDMLAANAPLGSTSLTVFNTSRFRVDDEIFIGFGSNTQAESAKIRAIPNYQTIQLYTPTLKAWTVADGSIVQKAINHQVLQTVYLGDLPTLPKFPCVTLSPSGETNEWMTLRATDHKYTVEIKAYVMADNFETTAIYLPKLAKQMREVLIDHVHPMVDATSHLLTTDAPAGSTILTVADTSSFGLNATFMRDNSPRPSSEENSIKTILSSTAIELRRPTRYDYFVARGAEIFDVRRWLYDSRPDNITYGFPEQQGGNLLKSASFNWYANEYICREGTVIV